jgi:hypothetical protein
LTPGVDTVFHRRTIDWARANPWYLVKG